jgi:hypothetical protein
MPLWDNVEAYGTARQTTGKNTMLCRKDAICMRKNYTKCTDIPSQYSILSAS